MPFLSTSSEAMAEEERGGDVEGVCMCVDCVPLSKRKISNKTELYWFDERLPVS